ncbi:MAG: hypothetical protein HOC91_09575 [Nitrospinaceae bacterium]|nr:hypothetical protein [Nitrospinaceae bacterium]MBT5366869.1 hypothetical protein [Nitrospinaceae bacterium]
MEAETFDVDLVFIDGDYSYEGVKSDYERFGWRVRVGRTAIFHDCFDEGPFRSHSEYVGRLLKEVLQTGEIKLVKTVHFLAHLERTT